MFFLNFNFNSLQGRKVKYLEIKIIIGGYNKTFFPHFSIFVENQGPWRNLAYLW